MRVVLIGTGGIASTHAEAIIQSGTFRLCGCYNRTPERGRSFAEKYGIPFFPSIESLLDGASPQVVVNILPPHLHFLGLEEAVSRACHIVVEKPFVLSIRECRAMISLAQSHGVRLAVSEAGRFNAVNRSFTFNRDKFGRTLHLNESNYRHYFNAARFAGGWGVDSVQGFGGMLLNVGVHRIAKMRLLAGAAESSVTATIGCGKNEKPVVGDASILIRYENSAAGLLQLCGYFPAHNIDNISTIVTEKGYVNLAGKQEFCGIDGEILPLEADPRFSGSDYLNFYRGLWQSLTEELPFEGNAEEAMRDVAVVLAALKSHEEEREVSLDEILAEK